jgi:hypothetical protein
LKKKKKKSVGQQALVIFLPLYLKVIESEGLPELRKTGISLVLQLASLDSVNFKQAMNSLEADQKSSLESALRGSLHSGRLSTTGIDGRHSPNPAPPSIELKSFG